jgi:hypothetical protein
LIELFEHPGPFAVVGLGRIGIGKVVVESENIAAEFLGYFRVVAP